MFTVFERIGHYVAFALRTLLALPSAVLRPGESLRQFRASVVALSPKLASPAQQLAEYAAKRRALF